MDRIGIFIDGGYLSKVLEKEFNKAKIDLLSFSENICKGGERLRTY